MIACKRYFKSPPFYPSFCSFNSLPEMQEVSRNSQEKHKLTFPYLKQRYSRIKSYFTEHTWIKLEKIKMRTPKFCLLWSAQKIKDRDTKYIEQSLTLKSWYKALWKISHRMRKVCLVLLSDISEHSLNNCQAAFVSSLSEPSYVYFCSPLCCAFKKTI